MSGRGTTFCISGRGVSGGSEQLDHKTHYLGQADASGRGGGGRQGTARLQSYCEYNVLQVTPSLIVVGVPGSLPPPPECVAGRGGEGGRVEASGTGASQSS